MPKVIGNTLGALLAAISLASATVAVWAQDGSRDALLGKRMLQLINSRPLKVETGDDELLKVLKARHNVALEGLKESYQDYSSHVTQTDDVFDAARRLVDSRLDVAQTPEEKLEIHGQVRDILVELERIYAKRTEALGGGESELIRIRFARLTTEAEIIRARRAMSEDPSAASN